MTVLGEDSGQKCPVCEQPCSEVVSGPDGWSLANGDRVCTRQYEVLWALLPEDPMRVVHPRFPWGIHRAP